MYYLIKIEKDKPEIISNSENKYLKIYSLLKYLDKYNIKYVDSQDEILTSGRYCYKVNEDEYIVYNVNIIKDGWIVSGYKERFELFKIFFQNYEINKDTVFKDLKKEIIKPEKEEVR